MLKRTPNSLQAPSSLQNESAASNFITSPSEGFVASHHLRSRKEVNAGGLEASEKEVAAQKGLNSKPSERQTSLRGRVLTKTNKNGQKDVGFREKS